MRTYIFLRYTELWHLNNRILKNTEKTKLRRKATCHCTQSVIAHVLQSILSIEILFVRIFLNLQMELPRVLRGVQLLPASSILGATKDDVRCSVHSVLLLMSENERKQCKL